MLRRFLPAIAMAGLLILGLSGRAHANLSVTLNTAAPATLNNNGTLPFNLTSGIFSSSGNAFGETALGHPATMDLSTLTISSTGAGTATLIFSMNNINSPTGLGTISETLTSHFVTGSGSVTFQTFGSNNNTLYNSLPLSPAPTGSTGIVNTLNGSSSGAFTATAPYSLTEVLTITFTSGGGQVSLSSDSSASFSAVPEPSTMALAGLGALSLIGYSLRRNHTKKGT
jgi:hypothetical protein